MSIAVLEIAEVRDRLQTLSVADYQRLINTGLIDTKTELIEGVVIKKITKTADHSYFSESMTELLSQLLPQNSYIRIEKPLTLAASEPEPDLVIVKGNRHDYRHSNPTSALLVVEIAKSSIAYDRAKMFTYAKAEVSEYWIVDIMNQTIEVYQEPHGDQYTKNKIYTRHESLPIFNRAISLADFFS